MATRTKTKRVNKVDTKKAIDNLKTTTKTVNNFLIDTTEMIVDETIDRTSAWQDLADKAIKGGFKLAEKQADITFKALETLKKQWVRGQKEFKERVSN